jgi:hypothetical protein
VGTVFCSLDEDGKFIAEDLKPGVGFTLQVVGPFESVVHEEEVAPLGSTEHRQVSIHIAFGGHRLDGRVLSEEGVAIFRALVAIKDRSGSADTCTTGRDGGFSLAGLPDGEFILSAEKRGWVRHEIPLVVGDSSPGLSEIRLQAGHDVIVEVLDANGNCVPEAQASGLDPTTGRTCQGHSDRAGRIHLDDLPPISCKVTVRVAGDVIERMHDSLVPRMRVDLPVPGGVEVRWSPWATSSTERDTTRQVVLRPIDPAHGPLTYWVGFPTKGRHRFSAVFPGEYAVDLEEILQYGTDGNPDVVQPIGSPVRVVVEAGRTVSVDL